MGRIRQLARAAPVNTAKATSRRLAVRFAQLLSGAGIYALLAVAAFLVHGAFDDCVLEEANAGLAITVAVLGMLSLTGGVALPLRDPPDARADRLGSARGSRLRRASSPHAPRNGEPERRAAEAPAHRPPIGHGPSDARRPADPRAAAPA